MAKAACFRGLAVAWTLTRRRDDTCPRPLPGSCRAAGDGRDVSARETLEERASITVVDGRHQPRLLE
jgi:hypothetical protein